MQYQTLLIIMRVALIIIINTSWIQAEQCSDTKLAEATRTLRLLSYTLPNNIGITGTLKVAKTATIARGLTVSSGGATITTGGLKVSAGGATITGTTTITGNEKISGTLAVTGNTTVGGNLSVIGAITGTVNAITGTAGAAIYAHRTISDSASNTASGTNALNVNNDGFNNTAFGSSALAANINGNWNTAVGESSLASNTHGAAGAAFGESALANNTIGNNNDAFGNGALYNNTTGNNNTGIGDTTLNNLVSGSNNIALGSQAGSNLSDNESDNIYIGHLGVSSENATMRLGTPGTQTQSYIAGATTILGNLTCTGSASIAGSLFLNGEKVTLGLNSTGSLSVNGNITCTGSATIDNAVFMHGVVGTSVNILSYTPVFIDTTTGKLGTVASSQRYKDDVQGLPTLKAELMQLRPVSFTYKTDSQKNIQYGLIAEEVANILPELVVYNKEHLPETVAYHTLPILLLNEYQDHENRLVQIESDTAAQNAKIQQIIDQLMLLLNK